MDAIGTLNFGAALAPPRVNIRARLKDFWNLTKPRMNFLVVVTTAVAYYIAAHGSGDWGRFVVTLLGTAFAAAGASVFNQVAEREFDALMPRTARRPIPAGRVRPAEALLFGTALSFSGIGLLAIFVNLLTASLAASTIAIYLFLYTPAKRRTTLCTIIGAIPGAIPSMMGFTAVDGVISAQALSLFAILFIWQMPHFLSIAILYRDDYARGGFQMLPVTDQSFDLTTRVIVLYSLALIPVTLVPVMLSMSGWLYCTAAVLLGAAFCGFGIVFARTRNRPNARQLFLASIIYLPALFAAMTIDKL